MPRYISKKSSKSEKALSYYEPDGNFVNVPEPYLWESDPKQTGLFDVNGNEIFRVSNPIGFGRDDEW